jgi:phosphate transport system permease protein
MLKPSPLSFFLRMAAYLAALTTALAAGFIIIYILIKGIPYLSMDLFALRYTSDNVSMMPALINTVTMIIMALLIAVPAGLGAAVYMTEYAARGSRLVKAVGVTAETLAGIPSIIFGLFGYMFFLTALKWGYSVMAGACTLAMMILPLMIRTAQEALMAVPDAYREGSFGLGAGRLRTVFRVVLPSAAPGILAGVILSVGRIAGETAALLYTSGTVAKIPANLMESGRTLAVHMYVLSSEGLYINQAYATAVVLLLLVICINAFSSMAAGKMSKGKA